VAGGANGALPHAEPGDDEIGRDTLVVVDLGCLIDGYCSDCTRTFATGTIGDEARAVYDLVLEIQVATLGEVRAGAAGADVDAFARGRIDAAGHGERFGHGLGHGVGIVVHEEPTLSRLSKDTLAAGNVVTVEPGVYLPDAFGVRIEDLVVVGDDGPEILSGFPKELTTVE
jgi:Xaa-Pro aminopeptidase